MIVEQSQETELARRRFIEDVGLLFEEMGQPRMSGKILGSLLICHPPYLSATELIAFTGGSKASISSMTHLLLQVGFLEKVGIPGKKKVYFRIKEGSFSELLKSRLSIINDMVTLTERGMELVKGTDSTQYGRLGEIRDLYVYFGRELPLLVDRWEKSRRAKYNGRI
jgi:DNA-binding transcriptional regulator GbsR (MarR family)